MKVECLHSNDPGNFTKSLQGHKIFKDQCVKCFHDPTQPEGLYICMKCFNGFCPQHRDDHLARHKHPLFINHIMTLKQSEEKQEITKLAIGKEGGALAGDQYEDTFKIYCAQCKVHDFDQAEKFQPQVQSLKNTKSPFKKQIAATWELEIFPCEHSLTLEQNPTNKDLSKCADCQLSTNLWLCLTCGNTGCGRKNWDGSGGNNHAIAHFEKTAHPLVVKLGTITAEGEASLYCYTCNNDVKDELLADHLSILGIGIASQKKTEKTMVELALDLNLKYSLNKLVEGNSQTTKIMYGPDYTGMMNIGNSCYLNSIVQTLNSLPEFKEQYYTKGVQHMKNCNRLPSNCFYCQLSKIGWGLNSGKYSQKKTKISIINEKQQTIQYQEAIKPLDFKVLIAENNAEFSSEKQQDALEYLQWLFDRLDKEEPEYGSKLSKLFGFTICSKMVCMKCNGIKLVENPSTEFKFPVPSPSKKDIDTFYESLNSITDEKLKESKMSEDPEYPVDFQECVQILSAGDVVEVKCPQCQINTTFKSLSLFKTTPKYLLVIPNRFTLENWVPKKKNALIKMPEEYDLSSFFLKNHQKQGEVMMKSQKKKEYSEPNIQMLQTMGYSRNACIRALIATKDDPEAACNWIFENMDKNLDAPLEQSNSSPQADPMAVAQVMEMGFEELQAKIALIQNKGDIPSAIEWLFGCGGDVSPFMHLLQAKPAQKEEEGGALSSKYRLKCAIVHLGRSVHHGHYVVYIKKNKEWVLFNDEKTTIPEEKFIGKGYIYVYEAM